MESFLLKILQLLITRRKSDIKPSKASRELGGPYVWELSLVSMVEKSIGFYKFEKKKKNERMKRKEKERKKRKEREKKEKRKRKEREKKEKRKKRKRKEREKKEKRTSIEAYSGTSLRSTGSKKNP